MTLTLRTDPSHPSGGFAILEGAILAGVSSITIENGFSGQFLGEDGKWARHPFALPVEGVPGGISLGPHIVDHLPTELQVEIRTGEGRQLGRLFWTDVIPSRTLTSVTSAQVIEDRRRAEERDVERIAWAARENIAARQAVTKRAEEEAAREAAERATAEAEASESAAKAPLAPETSERQPPPIALTLTPGCQMIGREAPNFDASPSIVLETDAIFGRQHDGHPIWTYVVAITIVAAFAAWMSSFAFGPDLATGLGRLVQTARSLLPESVVAQRSDSTPGEGCQLMSSAEEWRSGVWSAQIAVVADMDSARTTCMRLHQRFGKFYFDMPHIAALDYPGNRMYSVRLSGNLDRARSLCRFITQDGGDCSVVRSRVAS